MKKAYAIKANDGYWFTGEFDRSLPPCGYVDSWSLAMIVTSRDEAEEFAKEFGGDVVEFDMVEVR